MGELKAGCVEALREGTRAGEEGVACHLAKDRAQQQRRYAQDGGTAKDVAEDAGELRVGDGVRRAGVEGAAEMRLRDSELYGSNGILKGDPAHPLASTAQAAAEAKTEDPQQPRQGAAVGGKNHTEAQLHDTRREGGGRGLPCLAELRKKARARARGFGKHLVAAISVISGGRRRDHHRRRSCERTEDASEGTGGVNAAAADEALVGRRPATGGEGGSRQVNRRIAAFEGGGIGHGLRAVRVPLHLADIRIRMRARRSPDKEDDLISVTGQSVGKCLSYKASSAGHQDLTDHQNRCRQQVSCNELASSNGLAKPVGCARRPTPMVLCTT